MKLSESVLITPLEKKLIKSIRERLNEVAQEEIQQCKERIQQKIAEYAAGTAIKLMEYVKIDVREKEIVISIHMPKEKQ